VLIVRRFPQIGFCPICSCGLWELFTLWGIEVVEHGLLRMGM
jgi:hypothetical protein